MTSFTSATTSFGSRTALISALLLAAGCGADHPCAEDTRTVEHGVYGEIYYKSADNETTPLYDVTVSLMSFGGPANIETRTNKDGFYEFDLPAGTAGYSMCTSFATAGCSSFTITTFVRIDLIVVNGEAFWDDQAYGTCP